MTMKNVETILKLNERARIAGPAMNAGIVDQLEAQMTFDSWVQAAP